MTKLLRFNDFHNPVNYELTLYQFNFKIITEFLLTRNIHWDFVMRTQSQNKFALWRGKHISKIW